jgi:hypothetical protein
VFVLARPQTASLLPSIRAEALEQGDIIIVPNVMEHYNNITHQTLEVFRSAHAFHGDITHVCKCDDDTSIHVDRKLTLLAGQPFQHSWAGAMKMSFAPARGVESKWHVSKAEWPEGDSDIKWSNGPGYVLSYYDLVALLATGGVIQCSPGPLFKLKDIVAGSWLTYLEREQNITMNLLNLGGQINIQGCSEGDLVSHHMTPAQMHCMYSNEGTCC